MPSFWCNPYWENGCVRSTLNVGNVSFEISVLLYESRCNWKLGITPKGPSWAFQNKNNSSLEIHVGQNYLSGYWRREPAVLELENKQLHSPGDAARRRVCFVELLSLIFHFAVMNPKKSDTCSNYKTITSWCSPWTNLASIELQWMLKTNFLGLRWEYNGVLAGLCLMKEKQFESTSKAQGDVVGSQIKIVNVKAS